MLEGYPSIPGKHDKRNEKGFPVNAPTAEILLVSVNDR
jgi:hypothetical protein